VLAVGDAAATDDTDFYNSFLCHSFVLLFIIDRICLLKYFCRLISSFYRILGGFSMGLDRFLEVWWVAQNGEGRFGRNGN
jgi:hypothetical protein